MRERREVFLPEGVMDEPLAGLPRKPVIKARAEEARGGEAEEAGLDEWERGIGGG